MPSLDNARGGPSARSSLTSSRASDRHLLVRRAFLLEWLTLAWLLIEAFVAVAAAVGAHSLSLLAFGIDSVIELISACVLLWRLTIELKHGQVFSEQAERTASRIGGGLLFALALYVVVSAAVSFWQARGQDFSASGLVLTIAAIPIMWWLSRRKLAIAEQLGSRALRTDAMESIICGYLSVAVVVGLLAQLLLGAWWVDGVTSLAIVYFLVKEGREGWEGDKCCAENE
jgi:divalent metal cation (Fe/Co/Zn/Cd) transporter